MKEQLLALLEQGNGADAAEQFLRWARSTGVTVSQLGDFLSAAETAGYGGEVAGWLRPVFAGGKVSPVLCRAAVRFFQQRFDWQEALSATDRWHPENDEDTVARTLYRASSLERLLRAEEAIAELDSVADWPGEKYEMSGLRVRCQALAQLADHEAVVALLAPRLEGAPDSDVAADLWKLLGRTCDRLGRHEQAWDALLRGNQMKLADSKESYASNNTRQEMEVWHATCTPEWVKRWKPVAPAEHTPVFLVGFPRSGTTLLEQVLDAHSDIRALEEKPGIEYVRREAYQVCRIRAQLAGRLRPEMSWKQQGVAAFRQLASLGDREIGALRERYFNMMAQYDPQWSAAPVSVDKYPLNLICIPFICRLFPGAKFIVALRHPCDCVLSCFMQHFEQNDAMVNMQSIEQAGIFYRQAMRMLWKAEEALELGDDRVIQVRYEDLLTDFRGEAGRLLEFLGLPWEDSVERFDEHARLRGTLSTPSYQGVTQGLYQSARQRWLRYAEGLSPAMPHLREACERFGYDMSLGDKS